MPDPTDDQRLHPADLLDAPDAYAEGWRPIYPECRRRGIYAWAIGFKTKVSELPPDARQIVYYPDGTIRVRLVSLLGPGWCHALAIPAGPVRETRDVVAALRRIPVEKIRQLSAQVRQSGVTGPNLIDMVKAASGDERAARRVIVARYARPGRQGRPQLCVPSRYETRTGHRLQGPRADGKVIYPDREAAELAATELELLGGGPQRAYECRRSRHGHHHLTHDNARQHGEPVKEYAR